MTAGAVIIAAGAGKRFGADKTFALLAGRPVLAHAVETFERCSAIDRIVVVLAAENVERGRELADRHDWRKVACCQGGARRRDSVLNGLLALRDCQWVAIHDGARPLVNGDLIQRGMEEARQTGAAIAAVPAKDTVKLVGADGKIESTPDRRRVWLAQTPQIFRFDTIVAAHRASSDDVTDDAVLVERLGIRVVVYSGSYDNIKITTPEDLALAECLLCARSGVRD